MPHVVLCFTEVCVCSSETNEWQDKHTENDVDVLVSSRDCDETLTKKEQLRRRKDLSSFPFQVTIHH